MKMILLKNFLLLFMSLLTAPIVKNSLEFTFFKEVLKQTINFPNTKEHVLRLQ